MIPGKETIKKLRKLQRYILAEPRRFDMDWWGLAVNKLRGLKSAIAENIEPINRGYKNSCVREEGLRALKTQRPPCGTVACLAGNACIVAGLIKPKFDPQLPEIQFYQFSYNTAQLARDWLGITDADACALFYVTNNYTSDDQWPAEFAERYCAAKTPKTRAKIACQRIDHYISTGE